MLPWKLFEIKKIKYFLYFILFQLHFIFNKIVFFMVLVLVIVVQKVKLN